MRAWRDRLGTLGAVETLDYPYRIAGRKAPDKLPVLIAAHREALARVRSRHPGAPVVLAGKSMGSRVGCHVALEEPVAAVVCLGYPLRGAGDSVRDEVLLNLQVPILFVQGTRDPLCPLDLLETVRVRMTAANQLLTVDGGNHSLEVLKGRAPRDGAAGPDPQVIADTRVLEGIGAFVSGALGDPPRLSEGEAAK